MALGGLVLNAILNPILIYGRGEFEGMGVSGAALATVVSQTLSCLFTVSFLARQRWIDRFEEIDYLDQPGVGEPARA